MRGLPPASWARCHLAVRNLLVSHGAIRATGTGRYGEPQFHLLAADFARDDDDR